MEIIFLIVGILIGAIAVWFIASSKFKGDAGRVEERSRMLEVDKSSLQSDLKSERDKSEKLNSENSSLKSDYSNLQTKTFRTKSRFGRTSAEVYQRV